MPLPILSVLEDVLGGSAPQALRQAVTRTYVGLSGAVLLLVVSSSLSVLLGARAAFLGPLPVSAHPSAISSFQRADYSAQPVTVPWAPLELQIVDAVASDEALELSLGAGTPDVPGAADRSADIRQELDISAEEDPASDAEGTDDPGPAAGDVSQDQGAEPLAPADPPADAPGQELQEGTPPGQSSEPPGESDVAQLRQLSRDEGAERSAEPDPDAQMPAPTAPGGPTTAPGANARASPDHGAAKGAEKPSGGPNGSPPDQASANDGGGPPPQANPGGGGRGKGG